MRKTMVTIVMASVLSIAAAGSAMAAWNQDGTGWWYQYSDGSYASSGIRSIEGSEYYFDNNGYMKTGWISTGDHWYYFQGHGPKAVGWIQLDGKWYYLDPSQGGAMHRSWLYQGGSRYYMDNNGVMQTGIFFLDDEETGSKYAYQADGTGALITNQTINQGKTRIKYDERGRIQFRNSKTEEEAKRFGTNVWQFLLSQSQLDEEADSEETIIREIQDDLWDSYKKDVKKAKKAEREDALQDWKDEVRSELDGYLSSSQIEAFIQKVIGD